MVYPGQANVTVAINDTTCSDIDTSANTSCTAKDRNYTITLTLKYDVGKAEPVTLFYNCKFYGDMLRQWTAKYSLTSARFYLQYLQWQK